MSIDIGILTVRPGFDFSIEAQLAEKSILATALRRKVVSIHRRTRKRIETDYPLFNGYVLADVGLESLTTALNIPGVTGFLHGTAGDQPYILPDEEYARLLFRERTGVYNDISSDIFTVGDRVIFDFLTGETRGIISKVRGSDCEVTAEISGKKTTITLSSAMLRAVQDELSAAV